ncbi:MAG: divergent polysaccharide deacetylase family protein [Gammaproteobacteria bacterium]|nr:divergent polysaccharide deacetylase family protein [Gammaproteobacteria bacterium]
MIGIARWLLSGALICATVAAVARKVFLDDQRDPAAIRRQFAKLIEIARRDGSARAIGHPYPETLSVLTELLPRLAERRVRLIPVSRLIDLNAREVPAWRASLSH